MFYEFRLFSLSCLPEEAAPPFRRFSLMPLRFRYAARVIAISLPLMPPFHAFADALPRRFDAYAIAHDFAMRTLRQRWRWRFMMPERYDARVLRTPRCSSRYSTR